MIQNQRYIASARQRRPRWYRQLLLETAAAWGSTAALLLFDWRKALFLVVLPHLWALYGITTVNFLQHDGCAPEHPFNHSRNFVGRAFNWLTFNNGFHGVHHQQPGLHWSLLPAAHAERFHGERCLRKRPASETPPRRLSTNRFFYGKGIECLTRPDRRPAARLAAASSTPMPSAASTAWSIARR